MRINNRIRTKFCFLFCVLYSLSDRFWSHFEADRFEEFQRFRVSIRNKSSFNSILFIRFKFQQPVP